MTKSLFRQQAIEEQKDRLYGEVIITQPISFYGITFGFLLAVVSIILMLIYGSYARRETVTGYLVPDKGLVKIYAPLQGILSKMHIREGQHISKDDLLFTVSTLKGNEQGNDRDALLLVELEQQKSRFTQKIQQEKKLNETKLESLNKRITDSERELTQLETSITLQEKQLALSAEKIARIRIIFSKNHISEDKMKEAEKTHLDNKVHLQASMREKIQLQSHLSELNQNLKLLPLEWQSHLIDLNQNLSDIEQRIVEVSGRRIYTIKAPISGRLTALQISEGQSLNTHSPLIAILPEGEDLHAELFLPTRAAGFIAENQTVYLRYHAFPYQHYGLHKGHVKNIAQVILAPKELPIPVSLNEPVYRVKVALEHQRVSAYGKDFPLQAGMLLDADIVLEERSLGQWLLEPIYGLRGKL